MLTALLGLHSAIRWLILVLGVVAVVRAGQGLRGDRPYATARRAGVLFLASLHLQLLLGMALFMVSPLVRASMSDMQATMANRDARFFVAEHPVLMVAAVIVATIGGLVAKNAATDAARHRKALVFLLVTIALLLAGIPWQQRGLI